MRIDMGQPHSVGQQGNAVPRFGSRTPTPYRGRWSHLSGRHGKAGCFGLRPRRCFPLMAWQKDRLRSELCHATDVNPFYSGDPAGTSQRTTSPDNRRYLDYTRCDNTLNYKYRIVRSLIIDCLPRLGSRLRALASSSTLRFVRADTSCRHLV
jgi:hypothetical protein